MSLSKYFKKSDSFQPENIVKTEHQKKSGWQTLSKEYHPDQFQPARHLNKSTRPASAEKKDPASELPGEEHMPSSPSLPPDSAHIPGFAGAEKTTQSVVDADKYIGITEAEEQIKKAYEDGVKAGLEKAEEDYGSAIRSLTSLCQQLDTLRETIAGNSSRDIQDFALAVAERIIRTSLKDNDTTIIATIDEALRRAVKSEEFHIYINPDDYDIVLKKSADFIAGLSGLSNIVIKKDSTVEKGGAKIESDNCTIDATIAGQFEVILEEMRSRL